MKSQRYIDNDPTVRAVAESLGVSQRRDLRDEIAKRAVDRVESWMTKYGIAPSNLEDVHAATLHQTRLKIERIEDDEDLGRIQEEYRSENGGLPVQLELEFSQDTEALVFQRGKLQRSGFCYVAVVDARGDRQSRAWFAERHEPGHLVIPDPSAQVLWRRTQQERPEPIEQVVDAVASEIGFWRPIVVAELRSALSTHAHVLEAFESARDRLAPRASREACYRAFARLVDFPLFLLRVGFDCRKEDRMPGGDPLQSLALRAKTRIWNGAAEAAGMRIWGNYRIPEHSVIALSQQDCSNILMVQDDNLSTWPSQSGRALQACPIRVTAIGSWASLELSG